MNNRFLYLLYIVSTLFILSLPCKGQTARFFSADDFLTNSLMSCLMQDSRGFIWVGTRYGLTRYDGHRFRHFTHDDQDTLSLGTNNVLCMTERHNDGVILIGTNSQLSMYDYCSLAFHRVPIYGVEADFLPNCYVRSLLSLPDGVVLGSVAGFGIFRMEKGENKANLVKELDFPGFADVTRMAADRSGAVWMLTELHGVCRMTMKGGKYRMKKYLEHERTALTDICTLADGRVAIGTAGNGVLVFNPKSDSFSPVPASTGMNVLSLCATRSGSLLVGTEGYGMFILGHSSSAGIDGFAPYAQAYTPMSYWNCPVGLKMDEQKVWAMIEDRDSNLWMAFFQKGLLMQPFCNSGFETVGRRSSINNPIGNHCVMSVEAGRDGELWVGMDNDGIKCLGRTVAGGGKFTVMNIAHAHDGKLWLATYLNGCLLYDPQTGDYTQLECTSSGDALHVMDVLTDPKGYLWIATNGDGLIRYSPATGQYEKYKYDPEHLDRTNVVSNNWVNCLTLSCDKKHLFVGMSDGMMSMNLETGLFDEYFGKRISLIGSAVRAVREDKQGKIWAATSTGLYDVSTCKAVTGLPTADVASVEVAEDGTLWAGTIHGLCHYNPATGEVQNYFVESGLQGNEYSNGASVVMPDGRLVFGGSGGISMFRQDEVTGKREKLHVCLTGIMQDGIEVTADTRSGWMRVCDGAVMDCRSFTFAATDNSFILSFSTMDFVLADGIQYAYRLRGNDEWIMLPQGMADLNLNQLSPGTYNIEVKALSGIAESDILSLSIVVRPPIYATWWAYLIYILIVALVVWRIFATRNQREQARLRIQEYVHAADLREQRVQQLQQLLDSQMTKQVIGTAEEQKQAIVPSPDEQLLEKVIKVVKKHLGDSDFSVEFLASEVALSRSQLHRRMKVITGQTVSDFIRTMRLKHAAQLIENGHLNMSEVAYACGFETPSSFSTAFKRFYGVAPSEFAR